MTSNLLMHSLTLFNAIRAVLSSCLTTSVLFVKLSAPFMSSRIKQSMKLMVTLTTIVKKFSINWVKSSIIHLYLQMLLFVKNKIVIVNLFSFFFDLLIKIYSKAANIFKIFVSLFQKKKSRNSSCDINNKFLLLTLQLLTRNNQSQNEVHCNDKITMKKLKNSQFETRFCSVLYFLLTSQV